MIALIGLLGGIESSASAHRVAHFKAAHSIHRPHQEINLSNGWRGHYVIRINGRHYSVRYRKGLSRHLIRKYKREIREMSLRNVNSDRLQNGLKPLHPSRHLKKIANQRAAQIMVNFAHRDRFNRSYFEMDAANDGHPVKGIWEENISRCPLGTVNMIDNHVNYGTYSLRNGNDVANFMNDAYMNYDSASNWGHRFNILSNHISRIGIGVRYDSVSHNFYQTEDFEN